MDSVKLSLIKDASHATIVIADNAKPPAHFLLIFNNLLLETKVCRGCAEACKYLLK